MVVGRSVVFPAADRNTPVPGLQSVGVPVGRGRTLREGSVNLQAFFQVDGSLLHVLRGPAVGITQYQYGGADFFLIVAAY